MVPYTMTKADGTSVTFPIPNANSSGNDNVVATGQTISMKAADGTYPVPGTFAQPGHLDLLVASTCGALAPAPSKNLTLEFGQSGSTDTVMNDWNVTSVPDWWTAADTSQTFATTDHIDVGTTTRSTPVTLYLLQARIPQDYGGWELRSVTLPRVGTDFTQSCDINNNALHVLAMSTDQNP